MHSTSDPAPLRIVIVDDHAITRAACRALLQTEGGEVLADIPADDAALRTVVQCRPDVVVFDVKPGDPSGFELSRQIRMLPAAPRVVLTSSADPAEFAGCIECEAFVAKADICFKTLVNSPDPGNATKPSSHSAAWSARHDPERPAEN